MKLEDRKILVFDIEVVADNFDEYEEDVKEYLLKYATDEESRKNTIESLVFSPFTSSLVAIGMWDMTEEKGAVLMNVPEGTEIKSDNENINYVCGNEKHILEIFWKTITEKGFNLFVTFNGREFDCPYLMLRSLLLEVKPSYNLMRGGDYSFRDYHIDILKELTFFKHSPTGARRKYNLDFYCKKLGVTSPKSGGVSGDMVGPLYQAGEFQKIADYAAQDILGEANLFKRINNFLI